MQTQPVAGQRPTRRNFIVWWMTGILGAFAAVILAPVVVFLFPSPRKGQQYEDLKVTLPQDLDSMQDGDAVSFQAPPGKAFIMTTGGGNNAAGDATFGGYLVKSGSNTQAFSVTCSHLGCSVQFDKGAKQFNCPCHGSQFFANGKVKHGPATDPLAHLGWKPGDKPNEIKVYGLNFGQGGS